MWYCNWVSTQCAMKWKIPINSNVIFATSNNQAVPIDV